MCGIYGIVKTKGPAPDAKAARQWSRLMGSLAALSTQRGVDSAGIMRVQSNGEINILKDAVPAWELMTNEYWRGTSSPDEATVATIGHTRYATHGLITQANAHPFAFTSEDGDTTAGVHNGVISNHARLRVGEKVYAVDSANLIAALATERPKRWNEVLRRAEGTLAVAMVRVHDGKPKIFLTRRGNPLWIVKIAEFGAYAFASTKDILNAAIKTARLSTIETAKEVDEGVLYTFKAGGFGEGTRWWSKPRPRKNRKTRASKAERKSWGEEHADSPGRAMGTNGKEYARCGSCLDWDEPSEMHIDSGRILCTRCKIAADAFPKGPKGKRWAKDLAEAKAASETDWDDSRWGDGTVVAGAGETTVYSEDGEEELVVIPTSIPESSIPVEGS